MRRQHGVIERRQLLALGLSAEAIRHRLDRGRLYRVHRGVYVVGRPELTQEGRWMAAVLAAGPGAALSHESAAQLWGIRPRRPGPVHVVIPARARRERRGIVIHRRSALETTGRLGIPLTRPAATLTDLATQLRRDALEAAVSEADKLDVISAERLREEIPERRPGAKRLRLLLDRHTFRLTDSTLERRYLKISDEVGLPRPETQHRVDGFRTDFVYHELNLVVETDGLRYHRTPAQQAKDRVRDQEHLAAGRTPLRFTHAQIAYEAVRVKRILGAVSAQLTQPLPQLAVMLPQPRRRPVCRRRRA